MNRILPKTQSFYKVLALISGSAEGQPADTPIARFVFDAIVVAIAVPLAALVIGVLGGLIP